jgi:hypothetical protein
MKFATEKLLEVIVREMMAVTRVSYIFGMTALHGRDTLVNSHSERRPNGADDLVSADPFLHLTVSFTYSNRQQIGTYFTSYSDS